MNRRIIATFFALAAVAPACANQNPEGPTGISTAPAPDTVSEQAVAAAQASAAETAPKTRIPLELGMHKRRMTEIAVGPRGHAALTLDTAGSVRLWPDLRAEDLHLPVVLPLEEPVWMSIAQAGEDAYVVAAIDTAGGAWVGRVEVSDAGAQWVSLFVHPVTDPLFELHVLDGGERIVALGVDHRLHVWDTHGETVAQLDEPGFVPWQLRIAQAEGKAPKIMAVLAGPVRVQPLSLVDDKLTVTGEARSVALDRGPNRNDLTMTPDGSTVMALRRPKARGKRFELEVIDVATGARKIVAAESDLRRRPRVHPIDATRVLMESGSGQGFYVDFDQASVWPPVDGEADRELIPNTPLQMFALPQSTKESRVRSVVTDSVRFVPNEDTLVIDPLDADAYRTVAAKAFGATAAGLDAKGQRVIWGTEDTLWLENADGSAPPTALSGAAAQPAVVAFVDSDTLAVVDNAGKASLRAIADGQVKDRSRIAFEWGIAVTGWRPGGKDSRGHLVLSSDRPSEPLHVLDVGVDGFGDIVDVPREARSQWPEGGKPRNAESRDWMQSLGLSLDELGLRVAEIKQTSPSPDNNRLLIFQTRPSSSFFDEDVGQRITHLGLEVLTMYDRERGTRLWTRRPAGLRSMSWSDDGSRFVYVDALGGYVCDAATGEVVHERHDLGLDVQRHQG